jgi:solute carrier family 13 (sodium-dependent dicarboxylate transporter), member 2/3/5
MPRWRIRFAPETPLNFPAAGVSPRPTRASVHPLPHSKGHGHTEALLRLTLRPAVATASAAASAAGTAAPALLGTLRSQRLARQALAIALAAGVVLGAALWPGAPGVHAQVALAVLGLAIVAWTLLDIDESVVALAAALALVASRVVSPTQLYATLGDELIWLLLGGFVLAAVVQGSGLAERLVLGALPAQCSVRGLMWRLMPLIAATAWVIPSTSARAVLLLPVLLVLARAVGDARVARALALLFISIILLSAGASLLGAGAHLVAVDAMRQLGVAAPGFGQWIWWAAPVSLAGCALATGLIGALFLAPAERRGRVTLARDPRPMAPAQRRLAWLLAATVLAWATGSWHGIDAALVALVAALLATQRAIGGMDFKQALRQTEWGLLIFLAATMLLGRALIDTGAAAALAEGMLASWPTLHSAPGAVLALAAAVALLSHLVITSRSARAVVLIPAVALPLAGSAVDPAALIMLVVLGSGFCQTFIVSAKPVALFARSEAAALGAGDLLRLALALAAPLFVLLWAWAYWVWPLQGLPWAVA